MMTQFGWDLLAERRAVTKSDDDVPSSPWPGVHAGMVLSDPCDISHQREHGKVHHHSCRTITMQYSFFPDTARLWKSLPQDVATAQSLESFKTDLDGRLPR